MTVAIRTAATAQDCIPEPLGPLAAVDIVGLY